MGLGHSQFSGDLSHPRSHRDGKDTGCSVEPRILGLCYSTPSPRLQDHFSGSFPCLLLPPLV